MHNSIFRLNYSGTSLLFMLIFKDDFSPIWISARLSSLVYYYQHHFISYGAISLWFIWTWALPDSALQILLPICFACWYFWFWLHDKSILRMPYFGLIHEFFSPKGWSNIGSLAGPAPSRLVSIFGSGSYSYLSVVN